jgi:hypothetical protein
MRYEKTGSTTPSAAQSLSARLLHYLHATSQMQFQIQSWADADHPLKYSKSLTFRIRLFEVVEYECPNLDIFATISTSYQLSPDNRMTSCATVPST